MGATGVTLEVSVFRRLSALALLCKIEETERQIEAYEKEQKRKEVFEKREKMREELELQKQLAERYPCREQEDSLDYAIEVFPIIEEEDLWENDDFLFK